MKCVICKKGETKVGKTVVMLVRDGSTFVFKNVPAQVCSNCGEEYVDEKTTATRMAATTFNFPPQWEQASISIWKTRFKSWAQVSRRRPEDYLG